MTKRLGEPESDTFLSLGPWFTVKNLGRVNGGDLDSPNVSTGALGSRSLGEWRRTRFTDTRTGGGRKVFSMMARIQKTYATLLRAVLAIFFLSAGLGWAQPAAEEPDPAADSLNELMTQIQHLYSVKQYDEALRLTDEALLIAPDNSMVFRARAGIRIQSGDLINAREDLGHVLRLEGPNVQLLMERGMIHFRLGDFGKSVADFDGVLKLDPSQASETWARGISLYYAKEYEAGRRQFEFAQRSHPGDLENALWKFMCIARFHGVDVARATLITENKDGRAPMDQIHAFYKGRISESDLLIELEKIQGSPEQVKQAQFFGYAYLGFFYDSIGEKEKGDDYLRKAMGPYYPGRQYLAFVADVHLKRP